jgi:nucleotide-binding universal stress UspA family protein
VKEPVKLLGTVLFATDLSEESAHAVRWVRWLHSRYRPDILVMHILDLPPIGLSNGDLARQKNTAEERLRRFVRAHHLDESGFRSMLLTGDVAVQVEKFVKRNGIDCIVLGSRASGLHRLFLGSMSEEIYRNAACPVVIVGPKATTRPSTGLKRLLFATDLSKPSRSALEVLGRTPAIARSAELAVAHFIPRENKSVVERYKLRKQLQARLIEFVPTLLRKQITEVIVEPCPPAQGAVEFAKAWQADLIVLGVRSGGPFTRAATHGRPSITHRIIQSAVCPVLTIRA